MNPLFSRAQRWTRLISAATAVLLVAGTAALTTGPAAQADSLSQISVQKTASATSAPIGTSVVYDLRLQCFSTTDGCLNVTLVDQLPAGLSFDGFVPSAPAPSFATWSFDAVSRQLSIKLTAPLASGSTPTFSYSGTITSDGTIVDGDVLTNTATVTASNAVAPGTDTASVTATYSPFGRLTSGAAWDDEDSTASGVEFSDKASTLTVSGLNAGNRAADSLTIAVPGTADPIFDSFNATSISGALPAGATSAVLTLKLADGTTVSPSVTISGSTYVLPAAFDLSQVVGASVTFSGSIGGTASLGAPTTSAATLVIGVTQRDTQRLSGTNLITNGVDRTITGGGHVSITYPDIAPSDCNDCIGNPTDSYTVLYPKPAVVVVKSDYKSADGKALVEGMKQEVSNTITATNKSIGGIGSLKIVDAQPGLTNPFVTNDIDLKRLSISFPTGAEKATVVIALPSGDQSFALAGPVTNWVPTLSDGASLADATGFEITFSDTDGINIPTNAVATVTVISSINDQVTVATPGAGNSSEATVTSAVLDGSAGIAINTSGATKPLNVTLAKYSVALTKKVTNPFLFVGSSGTTQFRQTATVGAATPTNRVVIQDPVDAKLTDASNPFRIFDAVGVVDTTVPTDAVLNISYFDKTDNTWKAVSGFQGLTGLVQSVLPPSVIQNALGLRYEYIAADSFAPGRIFTANIQAQLRSTDRVTGAAAVASDWRNCSAVWLGADPDGGASGPESAFTELKGSSCPSIKLGEFAGGGVGGTGAGGGISKVTPYKEVKEQSEVRGTPQNTNDSLVYTYVPFAVRDDNAKTLTLVDSSATAPEWWRSFDLELLGGPIAGAYGNNPTSGQLRLTKYQTATVDWLNASGATLGTTVLVGTGTDQASAKPFQISVVAATAAAGVAYNDLSGYRLTFSETTSGGQPLEGDPQPGQLENAFFGQYNTIRGVEIGMQFHIRAKDRATSASVLDENCYNFDGNKVNGLECDPSVVGYLPLNSGAGDEGWINNVAKGELSFLDGAKWSALTGNTYSPARIVPAIVDVTNTTTLVRPVVGQSPATDMGVPPSGTPASAYPHATATSTAKLVQEVPVDSLVLSLPQVSPTDCAGPFGTVTSGPPCYTPVPLTTLGAANAKSPFDYFDLAAITITSTGTTIGSLTATVALANGSTVALSAANVGALSAQINGLANIADVVGLKITALPVTGQPGIAVGTSLTAALDLRLRPDLRGSGIPMQTAVSNGTYDVTLGTLGSATDVVANDHAASAASITLRAAGPGISGTKSFSPTVGYLDLLPTTQVTIPVANSGEVPVDSMIVSDIDDSTAVSDTWNSFDLVSLDSIRAPRTNGVIAADSACLKLVTWSAPGTAVVPACMTLTVDPATGTFPVDLTGVNLSTVRGIVVEFTNGGGQQITPAVVSADSAALVFSLKLRAKTVDTGDKVSSTTITNTAKLAVVLKGTTTTNNVSADFNPLDGSIKLDVEKLSRDAATGVYDKTSVVATSGDLIDYALIVRNASNRTIDNPSVVDVPPAQLLLSPSANSGFDIDLTADGVDNWTPLPAADAPTVAIAPSGIVTWSYPAGFTLKPGQSLRVRTGFQVAAGTSGSLTNVVGSPVANAAQCPVDTYNSELGLCTSTHLAIVSLRGGILVEKLTSALLGFTNQDGGTGNCTVATDPGFTKFPCASVAPTSDTFQYRAKLTNNGALGLGSVVLTDKLPGIQDTALTVGSPVGNRYGEWASKITSSLDGFAFERVAANGTVTTIASSAIRAFQTSGAVCALDVDSQPSTSCAGGDWTAWSSGVPAADATGIQFTFDLANAPLMAGETVRATWSAATPDAPLDPALDTTNFRGDAGPDGMLLQWNTVAGAGVTDTGGIFAGESSKAGATMDLGTLVIKKTLVDDRTVASDGTEVFTFQMTCLAKDGSTVAEKQFTMAAAALVGGPVDVSYLVPAGADCTVTEVDSAGATATPVEQTVAIGSRTATQANILNRFSDKVGSVSLTKKVVGTAPADSTFEVTLTRLDVTADLIVVPLTAGQTVSIDNLPIGARYSVVETVTGEADVSYQGLTNGELVVGATPVSVTVTNTFTELPTFALGEISLTKKVVGTAPSDMTYEVTVTRLDVPTTPIVVSLKAGETVVVGELPVDARYSVVETVTGGASVTYVGLTDGAVTVQSTTSAVTVVNTFVAAVSPLTPFVLAFTGVTWVPLVLLVALAALVAGVALLVVRRRRLS